MLGVPILSLRYLYQHSQLSWVRSHAMSGYYFATKGLMYIWNGIYLCLFWGVPACIFVAPFIMCYHGPYHHCHIQQWNITEIPECITAKDMRCVTPEDDHISEMTTYMINRWPSTWAGIKTATAILNIKRWHNSHKQECNEEQKN